MSKTELETGDQLSVRFDENGLTPAIVQDAQTGEILMMGWMNEAALQQTLETRKATFYSRSRRKMWVKGESSGHIQEVLEARVDCDQDTIVLRCKSHGPCCHVGYNSCFYRRIDMDGRRLETVAQRVFDPAAVYKK